MDFSKKKLIENPGEWRVWHYEGNEGRLRLRPVPPKLAREFERKHLKSGFKNKAIGAFDERAVYEDRVEYMIIEVEGITLNGQPVTTREDKIFMMDHCPPFAAFVNSEVAEMMTGESEAREEAEKNSKSSPGGSKRTPGE